MRRIARIYPAFAAMSLLAFLVIPKLSGSHWAVSPLHKIFNLVENIVLLRAFFTFGAFAGNPFPTFWNGSVWTIQFEFICYAGIALLLVTGALKKRAIVLSLFITAWISSYVWIRHSGIQNQSHIVDKWFFLIPCYLAGTTFYLWRDRIRMSLWLVILSVAGLILACFVPYGLTIFLPWAGSYLAFYMAFQPKLHLPNVGRFGDFSYGVYLYAFPIQQLLERYAHFHNPIKFFFIATILSLICGVCSWYTVERRFLRPARRRENVVDIGHDKPEAETNSLSQRQA